MDAEQAAWLAEPPLSLSPWHDALLQEYFPPRLRGLPLLRHPLATQIIATRLANQFVDRLGLGAAERAAAEHDCSLAAVMEAFAFGFTALRLDDRTLADEAVAALPGPQRHACEAGLEQALGAMLSTVLARPAMQQPALDAPQHAVERSVAASALQKFNASVGSQRSMRRSARSSVPSPLRRFRSSTPPPTAGSR